MNWYQKVIKGFCRFLETDPETEIFILLFINLIVRVMKAEWRYETSLPSLPFSLVSLPVFGQGCEGSLIK